MGQAKQRGTYEERVKQANQKAKQSNINLNKMLGEDLGKFCQTIAPHYVEAYNNNPIMTNQQINELMSSGLPQYQADANLRWLEQRHESTKEMSAWYYEQGDTLFAKKGAGWTLIAGGLKEMGVFNSNKVEA
jgi:predicted outer membrane protein